MKVLALSLHLNTVVTTCSGYSRGLALPNAGIWAEKEQRQIQIVLLPQMCASGIETGCAR